MNYDLRLPHADAIPPFFWVFYLLVMLPQGLWLFRNCQKNSRFPWFWGIWGLVSFPMPIILYYFFVIRKHRSKKPEEEA